MVRSRPPAERIARRRVELEHVSPSIDDGRFAAKATIGAPVVVEGDVFAEGHEEVRGLLRWRHDDEHDWHEVPMQALGNDRFAGTFTPERLGLHWYRVVGLLDRFATWKEGLQRKLAAGQRVDAQLEVGARLLEDAATRVDGTSLLKAAARVRAGISCPSTTRHSKRRCAPTSTSTTP